MIQRGETTWTSGGGIDSNVLVFEAAAPSSLGLFLLLMPQTLDKQPDIEEHYYPPTNIID